MIDEANNPLHTLRSQILAVLETLRAVAATWPAEQQPLWAEYVAPLEGLARALQHEEPQALSPAGGRPLTLQERRDFGRLLRDKRHAAGFSRVQLARKAKLSDSTIKFLETARHPPSRATLIRLIAVEALKLAWTEVPGHPQPPTAVRGPDPLASNEPAGLPARLNCFLTASYDPLTVLADFAQFLQGAGGHVEQTMAYLDSFSAAAYLALCQHSLEVTELRTKMPLEKVARQIVGVSDRVDLQVVALGAGDGRLETRLARYLLAEQVPRVDLCLLDISQPLLTRAYRHAAEALEHDAAARVWAVQGNFHHLPLYTQIYAPTSRRQRRLFCLLGGTLANLEHEPRFLQHGLLHSVAGDLLLLDVPTLRAPSENSEEIQRRDPLCIAGVSPPVATWLGGPLWRHGKDVRSIDFHWHVDTQCPVPGSYALRAIAMVKSAHRMDRSFSMFRVTRYDPTTLAMCLHELGWEEIGARAYAGHHSLRLYRKVEGGGAAACPG